MMEMVCGIMIFIIEHMVFIKYGVLWNDINGIMMEQYIVEHWYIVEHLYNIV